MMKKNYFNTQHSKDEKLNLRNFGGFYHYSQMDGVLNLQGLFEHFI